VLVSEHHHQPPWSSAPGDGDVVDVMFGLKFLEQKLLLLLLLMLLLLLSMLLLLLFAYRIPEHLVDDFSTNPTSCC